MMTKRSRILPLMTVFDFCDTTRPCGHRDVTTVAPQALAMLNNSFVHEQSEALASRVLRQVEDPARVEQHVSRSFEFALGRQPTGHELKSSLVYLSQQKAHFQAQAERDANKNKTVDLGSLPQLSYRLALASLCHVLLNTNEFIYVD